MTKSHKYLVWRSGLAAALLLAGSPLLAQDNGSASAPPAAVESIGPGELSNFTLNGTVTRRAEPAAESPASPVRDPGVRTTAPSSPATDRPAPAVRSVAAQARPAQEQETAALGSIPSRPSVRQGTSSVGPAASVEPGFATPLPAQPIPTEEPSGFSPLPWIAALLLLGAGAVIYFGRQRQQGRHAAAGLSEFLGETASPQPAAPMPASRPVARRPEPRAQPVEKTPAVPAGVVTSSLRAASPPAGVVSASLRPWIELELEPSQAMVTDEHAAIAFDVTLFNSGSAPARDVAVEACLINAGQQQDVQLSQFYTSPGEVRDRIPAVAPLARITLKSAVRLPREAVQEYEIDGRKLFMPMVAVNSRYRWSSGEGQSAASFLVGRAASDSDKLAPLRLDQGKRGWKGLAARRYEKGIRS